MAPAALWSQAGHTCRAVGFLTTVSPSCDTALEWTPASQERAVMNTLCSLQLQCDDSVSGAFDSPDATSMECGPDSDMFQRCCARAQNKEAFPRRPFHQCVGPDLSCDLMWLQAGGKYFLRKKRKRKLLKEILMASTCRGQIG